MGDLLQFHTPAPKDGGKARILRRHALKERLLAARGQSLTMDHVDPEAIDLNRLSLVLFPIEM